jgi:hypothetical protein
MLKSILELKKNMRPKKEKSINHFGVTVY